MSKHIFKLISLYITLFLFPTICLAVPPPPLPVIDPSMEGEKSTMHGCAPWDEKPAPKPAVPSDLKSPFYVFHRVIGFRF